MLSTRSVDPTTLAGANPASIFSSALEAEGEFRVQEVVSFTGWNTLLLVSPLEDPSTSLVAKGFFGYNSVIAAAPEDLRAGLYGYYWYRELSDSAHEYAAGQFEQEIEILRMLSGIGAAPGLRAAQPAASVPYYVMEYFPAGNVRRWRAARPQLSAADAVTFARKLLASMKALHDRGIVHRDINCENVLVGPEGPVLADFGCALSVDVSEAPSGKSPILHWPPEYDHSYHLATPGSDLYGFGMLMYEVLTGTMPRYGAPPLAVVAPEHDTALIAVIEQCISWQADRRPAEVAACLLRLSEGVDR